METGDEVRKRTLKLLTQIEREAASCHKCQIALTRKHSVFGKGSPLARLVILGEGPGDDEDKQGIPFVGRAGKLLHRGLESIGYNETNTYFLNMCKCRCCDIMDSGWAKNRTPTAEESSNCAGFLRRQLEALPNKRLILAVGSTAMHGLLGADPATLRIGSVRGKFLTIGYGEVVGLATYHPSYLLREENAEMKTQVYEDFKLARDYLAGKCGEYFELDLKSKHDFVYDPDRGWADKPLPRSESAKHEAEVNSQRPGKLLASQKDKYITSIEVEGEDGVEKVKDVVQLTPYDKFLMEKKPAKPRKQAATPLFDPNDDDVPF